MNAIETLYRNAGLITEDGYVKVNDKLWIKSGPYGNQSWNKADKSTLPTKEELHEIYLKLQELILIQIACGLHSLRQIVASRCPFVWSSIGYSSTDACLQILNNGYLFHTSKTSVFWIIPVRRS